MRKIHLLAIGAVMMTASAFTWFVQPAEKLIVSIEKSKIHWIGTKVTGKHEGDILLKSGEVTMKGKKFTGGSFVIDMNSITCTDLTDAKSNKKLVGHLKADDFFGVAKHPTAELKITSTEATGGKSMFAETAGDKSEEYKVKGTLTIKKKTEAIEFNAYITQEGKGATAKAKITFNRSKFDVSFGLADMAVNDDVELSINIVANAK